LLHLLCESILQSEVVPSVDQQLVFEVLRRVEILARRLLSVAPALNTIVAGGDSAVLHLNVGGWVGKLALCV